MDLTYICSRLKGDEEHSLEFHKEVAKVMCRIAIKKSNHKVVPIAPHLYLPLFLDDDILEERRVACEIGLETLLKCNRMTVVVVDGIISDGMLAEIYAAQQANIPIDYFYCTKEEMEAIIAMNKE